MAKGSSIRVSEEGLLKVRMIGVCTGMSWCRGERVGLKEVCVMGDGVAVVRRREGEGEGDQSRVDRLYRVTLVLRRLLYSVLWSRESVTRTRSKTEAAMESG